MSVYSNKMPMGQGHADGSTEPLLSTFDKYLVINEFNKNNTKKTKFIYVARKKNIIVNQNLFE